MTYRHALVVGSDGVTRCTVCRAASYTASVIEGFPCSDDHYRGLRYDDTIVYGEIITGLEPPWPKLGDIWLQASNDVAYRDMYWIWADLGDGIQDWIDLDTDQPRNGENRLPATSVNPAVKIMETTVEVSNELLEQMGEENIPTYIVQPLMERLQQEIEQRAMRAVGPMSIEHVGRREYASTYFHAVVRARPIHPSITERLRAYREMDGRKPFRGANTSLI